jgi:LAS superfamily LD-carboxypeptidase LdcB
MRLNIDNLNISGTAPVQSINLMPDVKVSPPESNPNQPPIEPQKPQKNRLLRILKASWLWIVALLVVVAMLAGFYRYKLVNSLYQDQVLQCQNLLDGAKKTGVNVDDLNCDFPKLTFVDYFSAIHYPKTDSNQSQINDRTNKINNQISDQDNQISLTQTQLDDLQVDYKSQVQLPQYSDNISLELNQKQSYLSGLKNLLDKSIPKIADLIKTFIASIALLNTSDQPNPQAYLQKYQAFTQADQITNFKALEDEVNNVQKTVDSYPPKITATAATTPSTPASASDLVKYKTFTGLQFQALYESITYDKVSPPGDRVSITGDTDTDNYIYQFAENRGYKRRAQAVESDLVSYQGQRLQTEMQQALQSLQQEATKSGIKIGLVSGYRSISDQLDLFKSRFDDASKAIVGRAYTNQEIQSGQADKALDNVLATTSVPGYSRHHTGFTVDISDASSPNSFTLFKDTAAYSWISANNFLEAKKFGLIPSYPPGQLQAGPNPEEWEFVWVGLDKVTN